jgi:hypothetical protein
MKKYKSFSVFKRKEVKSDKAPGYDVLASSQNPDGTYEKSINIGGVWLKEGKDGNKFFSGKLSDKREYTNNEGTEVTVPGFVIVNEQELDKVLKLAEAMQQKLHSPLGDAYPTDVEEFPEPSDFEF